MTIAKSSYIANEYRQSVIKIDSYDFKCMKGRIYNPALEEEKEYESFIELVCIMEELFNQMACPMNCFKVREFDTFPNSMILNLDVEKHKRFFSNQKDGLLATFSIKILFRRNASWQGIIRWKDKEKQEHFRSMLELIWLIDSTFTKGQQLKEELGTCDKRYKGTN